MRKAANGLKIIGIMAGRLQAAARGKGWAAVREKGRRAIPAAPFGR